MPSPMIFRFLVPAEATALIVGEDGVTKQIPDACITVSDEGDTPGLSDRIITISGDQQHGEAACEMIIQRLYEAQEVASGDQGIFVLLVPDSFESEDVLQKVRDISGADIHLEPEAIAGTDEGALQIVGGYQETVSAVFQLGALIAFDPLEGPDLDVQTGHAAYFRDEAALNERPTDPNHSDLGPPVEKVEKVETELEEPQPKEPFLPEPLGPEAQPEPADPVDSPIESRVAMAQNGTQAAEAQAAEVDVEKAVQPDSPDSPDSADRAEAEEAEEAEEAGAQLSLLSDAEPLEAEAEEIEFVEFVEAEAETARQMPTSACFAVSASVAAWIVGRKGQSIISLRTRSKARIEVSNENSVYRMIEIHGEQDAVMLAIELLLEQMSVLPDGSPEFVRMVLPPNSAGYIIGRGGESIKELRRRSGAQIDLDQGSVQDDKLLKICGSVKEMTKASQLVAERLAADGKFDKRSDIDQLQALLTESNHLEASLTMLIPADAVNRVPKARLSQVERLTGSVIEVDGLGGRTSGVQQLQLVGTRNGNAMAILYLQEIFAEHLQTPGVKSGGQADKADKVVPRSKSSGRTNSAQNRPSSRGPRGPRGPLGPQSRGPTGPQGKGTAKGMQSRRQ